MAEPMHSSGFPETQDGERQRGRSAWPRILVTRVGALGDTLMATPALRAVRQSFPSAYLAALVSAGAADALRYNPHVDRVLSLPHWRAPFWLSSAKRQLRSTLKMERFDLVLVLESDARFLALFRSLECPRVVAYGALASAGGFQQAEFNPGAHMIDNHLAAARLLGASPAGREMEFQIPEDLRPAFAERLNAVGIPKDGLIAGLHAGWGGRKHPLETTRLKSWPPDRFAEVARWLRGSVGSEVVLTGSADDYELNELIARRSGVRCLNLAGRLSLLELAELLRRLSVYLTVDSGPAHLAAALGTPLVTLIGPAIIEQTAPLGQPGRVRILYHRVACAPCYGTPLMKSCRDNICMKAISSDEARLAVEQMLGANRLAQR